MDESGEFAVCESCGMKHSKDRVKAKVQEIKGVVEVTKGNAEKERLFANAHTFFELGQIAAAEDVYEQLIKDFPDDWRIYAEYAKIIMLYFPQNCSQSDIIELQKNSDLFCEIPVNDIGHNSNLKFDGIYRKYINLSSTAIQLSHDAEKYFNTQWKNHDEAHQNYIQKIYEKLKKNQPCFDKVKTFLTHDYFIPKALYSIFAELSHNAEEINSRFKGTKYKYDNIWKLGITNFKFDSDGTKKVDYIKYLSSKEAVLCGHFWQGEYGDFSESIIITFDQPYTLEQLTEKLNGYTKEEQSINWAQSKKCEKCGTPLDKNNICPQCGHINENQKEAICNRLLFLCKKHPDQLNLISELYSNFDGRGKLHDKSWDEFNSPRHHSEYNFEKFYVNDIELIGTELYVGYGVQKKSEDRKSVV